MRGLTLTLTALLFGVGALLGPASTQAAIKCWKNKDGVRECGNAVPPEYSQQETETKDKQGLTVKKSGAAKSLAELETERAAARALKDQEVEKKKRAALDRVLLDTFTSEDDLILTRDGQIAHLDSQIRLTQSHIDKLTKNLDQMIERAAEVERKGQKPGADIVQNIESVRDQIAENKAFIVTKRREQEAIRTRFEGDIARFRELKGTSPQ